MVRSGRRKRRRKAQDDTARAADRPPVCCRWRSRQASPCHPVPHAAAHAALVASRASPSARTDGRRQKRAQHVPHGASHRLTHAVLRRLRWVVAGALSHAESRLAHHPHARPSPLAERLSLRCHTRWVTRGMRSLRTYRLHAVRATSAYGFIQRARLTGSASGGPVPAGTWD